MQLPRDLHDPRYTCEWIRRFLQARHPTCSLKRTVSRKSFPNSFNLVGPRMRSAVRLSMATRTFGPVPLKAASAPSSLHPLLLRSVVQLHQQRSFSSSASTSPSADASLQERLVSLCKRRGFVFPSSEIYGGLSGSFDFGPLGWHFLINLKYFFFLN